MAAKGKYWFNPESLQFEGVRPSVKRTVKRIFTLLLTSFLIAAAYYFAYSMFFDTPTERAKKHENALLKEQLIVLNNNYGLLEQVINDLSVRDSNIYRAIFEANPIRSSELSYAKNMEYYRDLENYNNNEIAQGTAKRLSPIIGQARKGRNMINALKDSLDKKADELKYIPSIQPVKNKSLVAAGASIGMRINPYVKSLKMHTGMDFAVPVGTNVVATADGTVAETVYSLKGSGNRLTIGHNNNYETRYLYLNEIFVQRGQKVKRGQIIGKVGNLGLTVPHLHYEVRKDGKVANPLNYFFADLTPAEYERIIAISTHNGQSLD